MLKKPYVAEALGTFILTGAILLSLSSRLPAPTPVVAGLTLMLLVYILGPISGAHFNPAVTIALLTTKKISTHDATSYIVAQIIGAAVAGQAVPAFLGRVASVSAVNSASVAMAELLGAFILMFGITSVVLGAVKEAASGLVIGGSLLLGVLIASPMSNGVLNPAVAIGIGSVSATYLIAPIVGAVLAVLVRGWLSNKK